MAWFAALARGAASGAARTAVIAALRSDSNKQTNRIGYLAFTDYKDLIKALRDIEPKYATQLRRDFKKIAAPLRNGVSKTIPRQHPTSGIHVAGRKNVSGFKPLVVPGRLTWGANSQNGNIKPQHTVIRLTKQKSFKKLAQYGQMSIVKVEVDNAAVVMADMAGRSKKWINKRNKTKPYLSSRGKNGVTGMRQHRINGQGVGMIKALNRAKNVQKAEASRWIWPAALKELPAVQLKISDAIRTANRFINDRMKTR